MVLKRYQTAWVSKPNSGATRFFTHEEEQGGKGEGTRVFLTVMFSYVGGGWFIGRSDRWRVPAGKKDVGEWLPRVPSNLGGTGRVDG